MACIYITCRETGVCCIVLPLCTYLIILFSSFQCFHKSPNTRWNCPLFPTGSLLKLKVRTKRGNTTMSGDIMELPPSPPLAPPLFAPPTYSFLFLLLLPSSPSFSCSFYNSRIFLSLFFLYFLLLLLIFVLRFFLFLLLFLLLLRLHLSFSSFCTPSSSSSFQFFLFLLLHLFLSFSSFSYIFFLLLYIPPPPSSFSSTPFPSFPLQSSSKETVKMYFFTLQPAFFSSFLSPSLISFPP